MPNITASLERDGYVLLRDVLSPQLTKQLLREAKVVFDQRVAADTLPLIAMNVLYSSWIQSAGIQHFW
jgi:hypothetical protein